MLSKSRGQVLRVAAVMHMLFSIDNNDYKFEDIVSEAALKAAINLVETSCQQTAFVAGRGLLQEEVESPTCTPQPGMYSIVSVQLKLLIFNACIRMTYQFTCFFFSSRS